MPPVRAILVDDSRSFVQATMALLADRPGLRLCGHSLLSSQAVTLATVHRADLVLLDLSMPGLNGIEVTRLLKALPDPPRVVIVSLHDTPAYHRAAKEAGADGFIGKGSLAILLPPLLEVLFPRRTPVPPDSSISRTSSLSDCPSSTP